MIHVAPSPAPAGWDDARGAGLAWLEAHPAAARPRDYWSAFRGDLARGFGRRCGYTVAYVELGGTVDHFTPWARLRGSPHEAHAYAWDNLRFCSEWFNSRRRDRPVLDPYVVEDDWFVLLLPSCQLLATERIPSEHRAIAQDMLDRWLSDDEALVRSRFAWYSAYREGHCSLALLEERAPLVARALMANPEHLHPADSRRTVVTSS